MAPWKFTALLLLAPGLALAAPRYTVTALPAGSNPTAINASGQIAGDFFGADGTRAFLWSGGVFTPLGTLGGDNSTALAINDAGILAGYANAANGDSRAFRSSGGALAEIPVLGSTSTLASAINASGQIAGQYVSGAPASRAFLYSGGAAVDLGDLGGNFAYAAGINSAGDVVGVSALDDTSPFLAHAFLYRGGVMQDLGTLGGSYSAAAAINDAGQIVGNAWVMGSEHAFLYANGEMIDLGTLGGRRSFAYGINGRGQVVGNANDAEDFDYYAFLYEDGAMTDLNTLIDPALGWTIHAARGINDNQQIAAYGCRDGECGGLLLNLAPVPEPQTWLMLLAGLAVVLRKRLSAACRCA